MHRRTARARLALGARSDHILWLVLREGMILVIAGLTIGVVIAGMVAQLLQSQLFVVSAFDVSTYATAIAVITAACSLVSFVPARKATASNMLDVMRTE